MKLIDFAARFIPPAKIKAAGYDGIVAYVSKSRPGANFGAKPLTKEYADALRAAGLHVVSNFQYGKPGASTPSDFTRGFAGGVADAQSALQVHEAAGGPDTAPIIFSVDDDISLSVWNNVAVEWFKGINSVLGVERTGIYGHSRACAWAIQDGVVGRSTTPGRRWAWQTRAWSNGQREAAAVLYQSVVDTASNPGPLVDGVHVDENDVLAHNFGQWDYDSSTEPPIVAPQFTESTDVRSPYHNPREAEVLWFVLHTEDGVSPTARNLARYLSNNPAKVSYHFAVDNHGAVNDVVDTDRAANSVFEPGNSKSINLAFAGSYAKWNRQTWMQKMERGIDIAAWIAVRECRNYDVRPRVLTTTQTIAGDSGITDHNAVRIATGVGTHSDVGAGFPWDYFAQKVNEYAEATEDQTTPLYPGFALAQGATGRLVRLVQKQLNAVVEAGLLVDGDFGPLTEQAVVAFQIAKRLDPHGKVDEPTWELLFV